MGNLNLLNYSRWRHNDPKEKDKERRDGEDGGKSWEGMRRRNSNHRGIQHELASVNRCAIFKSMKSEAS